MKVERYRPTASERRLNRTALIRARFFLGVAGGRRTLIIQAVAEKIGVTAPSGRRAGYEFLRQHVGQFPKQSAAGKQLKAKQALAHYAVPHVATDEFLMTYEWRKLRMEVIKDRGARCECCGATPRDGITINVDHIKPRRKYPELALEKSNLQVLCNPCNHGKGNWDETDWRSTDAIQ